MNITRLRALIRETWKDKSPLWDIAPWYGVFAAYNSTAALALFHVAPAMLTGRPSPLPPPKSAFIVGYVVFGLVGAACGLCAGRFVNSVASDHPKLAFPLLFVALFVPPACMLGGWALALATTDVGVGEPLAWFGVLVAGCATNCYRWRRKGWPDKNAANEDPARGSGDSSVKLDQP